MAFQGHARGYATTTTTGTGTITVVNSSDLSKRTFTQALGSGTAIPCCYCIQGTNDFEIGFGTYNSGTLAITRDTSNVCASSNSNALVSFSAGTRDVFCWMAGEPRAVDSFSGSKTLLLKEWGNTQQYTGSGGHTLTLPTFSTCPKWINWPVSNDGTGALIISGLVFLQPGERGRIYLDGSAYRFERHRAETSLTHGAVRLVLDTGNLKLIPFDGNGLLINHEIWPVANAGVTLSPSGLSTSTLYYIYAYIASGAVVLEASTTAWSYDTAALNGGLRVKTGDATRTLVGMAYVIAGPTFGYVASYYRRSQKVVAAFAAATTTITGSTFQQFNFNASFLSWSEDAVAASLSGATNGTGSADGEITIAFDGTTPEEAFYRLPGGLSSCGITLFKSALSVGFHTCYPLGRATDPLDTISLVVENNSAGRRPALTVAYWA